MKIMITGAYGMLGSDLREVLKNFELICTGSKDLDITDEEKVMEFITEKSPDLVINAAAYTAVDDCETHFDEAYAVNALGPKNLAIACKSIDVPLVHISTDYVFDGSKRTPLIETDNLGPQSAYGKTKLEGEKFIQENTDKYFILRTAWLYGLHGNNFVKTMLDLAETHDEITVVNDQIGSPTYSLDLAVAITNLLHSDKYGIYHVTNEGDYISWYDFTLAIFETAGITHVTVNPVTSVEYGAAAKRPYNSRLYRSKIREMGFEPLPDWRDALSRYVKILKEME